jgi:hypothetical protein
MSTHRVVRKYLRNPVSTSRKIILCCTKKFLEPFWKEFRPDWTFCENFILSIVAFIPLGPLARKPPVAARVSRWARSRLESAS